MAKLSDQNFLFYNFLEQMDFFETSYTNMVLFYMWFKYELACIFPTLSDAMFLVVLYVKILVF